MLIRLLCSFIRAAGGVPFLEPTGLDGTGGLRPDIQVHFPGGPVLVDGSITHPSAKSYVNMASTTPLSAAAKREHYKHLKYDLLAADEKSTFIPFVLETFGGFGKEASRFIKKLGSMFHELLLSPGPRRLFSSKIYNAISVCLQRGNSLIQLVGCRVARQFAGVEVGFPIIE
jgi:hypothetical protein